MAHILYYYYFSVYKYFKDVNVKKSYNIQLPVISSEIPFFAIVFPQNGTDDIEFHWWVKDKKISSLKKPLLCPLNSIKDKLKNKVEYKFEYI